MLPRVNEALDASPVPASEWPALHRVLGPDLLARLLQISTVSLRRYQSGARKTPDDVAVRLHALALMVGDLAGAYNDAGIRRWFARPRTIRDVPPEGGRYEKLGHQSSGCVVHQTGGRPPPVVLTLSGDSMPDSLNRSFSVRNFRGNAFSPSLMGRSRFGAPAVSYHSRELYTAGAWMAFETGIS